MYIYREHEYRETISLLKVSIDDHSKKTLELPKERIDESLELEGGVRLNLQREEQPEERNDGVYREHKTVKEIHSCMEKIL